MTHKWRSVIQVPPWQCRLAQGETLTTHMMTLYTNSKYKSFLMTKRTKGNSTLEWTSALGILMPTFEQPRQSHMKPLRRLASRTGTFCLASFLPGWAICGSFLPCMSLWIIAISRIWIILIPPYSIGLQWQPGGLAVLACRARLGNSVMWFSSLSATPVAFTWSTIHGLAHSSWQPSVWSSLVYT